MKRSDPWISGERSDARPAPAAKTPHAAKMQKYAAMTGKPIAAVEAAWELAKKQVDPRLEKRWPLVQVEFKKILQINEASTALFHWMLKKDYEKLKTVGRMKIHKGLFSMTSNPTAIKGHFGDVLLKIDQAKIRARGGEIMKLKYDLDWLEKAGVLLYVSGEKRDYWEDWAPEEYPEANWKEHKAIINNEIRERYGFEAESIAKIEYLMADEVSVSL